jgi:hypothetical protein
MKNEIIAVLLVLALVVGVGIGYLGITTRPAPKTETLTNTTTASSHITTQTVVVYSSTPPQLLGTSGFITISGLANTTTYSDFFYFEANSSDQQSFDYTFPVGTSSGTIYLTANFSAYTPNYNAGGVQTTFVGGQTCIYYKVAFQDGSSENLTACGAPFAPRTYFVFTQHAHPQVGLAYLPNGAFYFLVSET